MVLLIASEGKKWSLHYLHTQFGGKMWEYMVGESGEYVCEGIIPNP